MAVNLQVEKSEEGTEIVGIIYNEKSKKAYMFSPGENKLEIGDVVTVIDGNGNKRTVMVVISNQLVADSMLSLPIKAVEEVLFRRPEAKIKKPEPEMKQPEAPIIEKKEHVVLENVTEETNEQNDRNKVLADLGLTEELLAKLESIPDIDDEKLNAPVMEYKPVEEKVNRMVIPGVGAFAVGEDHKLPKVVYVNRRKTEEVYEEAEETEE